MGVGVLAQRAVPERRAERQLAAEAPVGDPGVGLPPVVAVGDVAVDEGEGPREEIGPVVGPEGPQGGDDLFRPVGQPAGDGRFEARVGARAQPQPGGGR